MMADPRKGWHIPKTRQSYHVARQAANARHCAITDEEATTIKVASAKKHPVLKEKHANRPIKLKKPAPKLNKAGNWQEGSIVQGWWYPYLPLGWDVAAPREARRSRRG
jgi:hypothetical protein